MPLPCCAAWVLEGARVPAAGTEQARGAAPGPSCSPGCSQALCLGSRKSAPQLQLGRGTYVTPEFPAGQGPSALGSAAFQGFLLFDLTRGSSVSDSDVVRGRSLDPPSPSFYPSRLIMGLDRGGLVEAVGWCNPTLCVDGERREGCTQATPQLCVGLRAEVKNEGPQSHNC